LLSDTLRKYPNFQEAHYMMAGVLLKSGHSGEGIEELHRALELNPQDANAHLLLGQAYEEKGLRKEAAEEYKIALNISPNLELARIRLSALEK
jgi:predicted Zn-dependent protease